MDASSVLMHPDAMRSASTMSLAVLAASLTPPVQARSAPLVRFPTVSATEIAFVAEGGLWKVPRHGGRAVPLLKGPGQVLAPRYSPDGRTIAFTWRRGGSNDVWTITSDGGAPIRLTHGPSANAYDNLVTGWTADGADVLFVSARMQWGKRYDVYRVDRAGGLAVPLGLGHAGLASVSPDGERIVYDWSYRNLGADRWKRYRGGQAGELFLTDLRTRTRTRLTDWVGIDTAPMWAGGRLFFLSDRGEDHRLNLWSMDPDTRAVSQVTGYRDYDVDMPSAGPGAIAFQQGGRLRLLDTANGRTSDVPVLVDDVPEPTKEVPAARYVSHEDIAGKPDYALGPDGTAYLSARGDLFSARADGSWTDLTRTVGAAEDHPAISPDGRRLAFVTDSGGEQNVAVMDLGRVTRSARALTAFRSGVLYAPRWSPDGRWLALADAAKRLWLVSAEGGGVRMVASDSYAEIQDAAFSADSGRLAYSVTRPNQTRELRLLDLRTGRATVLSSPMESDHDPAFAPDGRSLAFVSFRRERPFVSDRDGGGTVATTASEGIYLATLPGPDDLDRGGFAASTRALPVGGDGGYADLSVSGTRVIYRATALQGISGELPGQRDELRSIDLSDRTDRKVADDAASYCLSPDGRSVLIHSSTIPTGLSVVRISGAADARNLDTAPLRVRIDPDAERRHVFEQAWRLDRDLFWDPRMNGVDWRTVHERYARLVASARSHEDLVYVLGEMQGELSTSHMFIGGGDVDEPTDRAGTALLGADFALDEASGRYRLVRIYRGDGSRPRFRAPLGDPALGVEEGDYLLAVDGKELRSPTDPYSLLTDAAGPVILAVSHAPDGPRRTLTVNPIPSEREVRKLDMIERNRSLVERIGEGRVGYVYLSDFYELGSEDFLRQYQPQSDREALIVDDRDNGGGFTSQWVLDVLSRPRAGLFRNREGGVTTLPPETAPTRLATVTNIFSASDGDQFPYFFRLRGIGPVVGQRTWGGVRGIKGPWTLADGTWITIPKDSLLTMDGRPIIENHGAEPDVPVDDAPDDVEGKKDRQLETTVRRLVGSGPETIR